MAELVGTDNMDVTFDSLQEDIRNLHEEYISKNRELREICFDHTDPDNESACKKSVELLKIQVDIKSKGNQLESICKDADTLKQAMDFNYEMMIKDLLYNFENVKQVKSKMAENEQMISEFKLLKNQLKQEIGQLAESGLPCVNDFVDLVSDTDTDKSNEETAEDVMKFAFNFLQMSVMGRLAATNTSSITVGTSDNTNDVNDESNSQGAMMITKPEKSDFVNMMDAFIDLMGGPNQEPSEINDKMEMIKKVSTIFISDDKKDV